MLSDHRFSRSAVVLFLVILTTVVAVPLAAQRGGGAQIGYEIYRWVTSERIEWSISVEVEMSIPDALYCDQWGNNEFQYESYGYTGSDLIYHAPSFGDRVGQLAAALIGQGAAREAAAYFAQQASNAAANNWPNPTAAVYLGTVGAVLAKPTAIALAGTAGAF